MIYVYIIGTVIICCIILFVSLTGTVYSGTIAVLFLTLFFWWIFLGDIVFSYIKIKNYEVSVNEFQGSNLHLFETYIRFLTFSTAGIIAIFGLIFASFRATQNDKQNEISENTQLDTRFKDAIELLGNEHSEIRLGAIHVLREIAKSEVSRIIKSNSYYRSTYPRIVCETLNYYYLNSLSDKKRVNSLDSNLALETLRNLIESYCRIENIFYEINLSNAHLSNLNLKKGKLKGAILKGAKLEFAHLEYADISRGKLHGSIIRGAFLYKTDLRKVRDLSPKQLLTAKDWRQAKLKEGLRDTTETLVIKVKEALARKRAEQLKTDTDNS